MDIVLEIFDTYAADRFYAWALPARLSSLSFNDEGFINATAQVFSAWKYKPATHLLHLKPGESAYLSSWPRDNIYRQFSSLYFITVVFGFLLYFICASLSYVFIFDKTALNHPRFLKNQVALEIKQAVKAMPGMALCTAPLFVLDTRGYCKLYDRTEEGPGQWYDYAQYPLFVLFTDFCIYWAHRGLHHPWVYKHLHKPHHKWLVPTPYASHAFHPLDGFVQSAPYHLYPMLFPLHKVAFICLFAFVNVWSILIHDGEYLADNPIINGSACHTAHHLYFNYNFGQYTTLWDRLGGSYRKPEPGWFDKNTKMATETWSSNIKEMEKIRKQVEGDSDDRTYCAPEKKKPL